MIRLPIKISILLKFWLIFLALLYIYVYSYFLQVKNSQNPNSKSFEDACDLKGEWMSLSNMDFGSRKRHVIFFKRDATFYFIDASFFRLHYISNDETFSFELFLNVVINGKKIIRKLYLSSINNISIWRVGSYCYNVIDISFNLTDIFVSRNLTLNLKKNIHLEIYVSERNFNLVSYPKSSFLSAKIKLLNSDFNCKKESMVCAKCFYLDKKISVLSLEWWIKLNKLIGHQKISFCDQSIDKELGFERILEKYKNILDIKPLKCIPNLLNYDLKIKKSKYLKSFKQIVDEKSESFDVLKVEVINQLIINECYLNNFDKYKYITVIDNDEIIVPKRINDFKSTKLTDNIDSNLMNDKIFDQIECNENTTLTNYLKSINFNLELQPKSYYFSQGVFLSYSFMIELTNKLSGFLKKKNKMNEFKFKKNLNLTFMVRNKFESDHAKALIYLNKNIIQPFYNEHKKFLNKYSYQFDRFFVIVGEANRNSWGKSIHDTRNTFDLSIHVSNRYINRKKFDLYVDPDFFARQANPIFKSIPTSLGYQSHFREIMNLKDAKISIADIHFDLNYFSCYFKPILKSLLEKTN